jgi:hypothetical protein
MFTLKLKSDKIPVTFNLTHFTVFQFLVSYLQIQKHKSVIMPLVLHDCET